MNSIDESVLAFFVINRTEWLSFLMFIITYSGSYMLIGGLTVLTALSFYLHRHFDKILPLLITVGGSGASVFLLKHLFYRARPIAEAIYLETGSSFPSGHATMAMALYGFIIYAAWQHDHHHLKNPLIIFLGFLIPLVAVSRLYLGVHHLTDVLAGLVIGFIWIQVGLQLGPRFKKLIKRF